MEDDPTSFEEGMRSVYSFKWQEAMKIDMNSMNTNDIWDLEEIPNGAKIVGCEGSIRQNLTPKGTWKDIKHDL